MVAKGMSEVQTARLLGTDEPTLSNILRGRTASISLEKLVSWLLVLGRSVEIRVFEPADPGGLGSLRSCSEGQMLDSHHRSPGPHFRATPGGHLFGSSSDDTRRSPVASVVWEVMTAQFGNANSVDHLYGEEAACLLGDAGSAVAGLVGADPEHVRFTSGATEAVRLALQIAVRKMEGRVLRVTASRAEHRAVLEVLQALEAEGKVRVTWLDVDARGRVSLEEGRAALGAESRSSVSDGGQQRGGHTLSGGGCRVAGARRGLRHPGRRDPGCGACAFGRRCVGHRLLGPERAQDLRAQAWARLWGGTRPALWRTRRGATQARPMFPARHFGVACRIMKEEGAETEERVRSLRDRLEAALQRRCRD